MEFKFTIKNTKTKKVKQQRTHTIIGSAIGVCNITKLSGWKVFVPETNTFYDFTRQSYIIRNKKYTIKLYNGKFYSITQLDKLCPDKDTYEDSHYYRPFMAGVICVGKLIRNNITNEIMFDLRDTYTDWQNPFAVEAIKHYRENYDYFYNQLMKDIDNE